MPRGEGRQTTGVQFFSKSSILSPFAHFLQVFPTNDILTLFPIQMHEGPMLTLPLNRSRSSQGHDLYKLCKAPVTDAPHQVSKSLALWFWRKIFLKFFSIYSHCSHLGHVIMTIYINFLFPFPRMLHIKFGFDQPSGFRGEDVSLLWIYTCTCIYPRGRGRQPPGATIFH